MQSIARVTRSSADADKPARRNPEGEKVSATGWPPTAVSYTEGVNVSTGQAAWSYSVFRPNISNYARVTIHDCWCNAGFVVEIENNDGKSVLSSAVSHCYI